MKPSLPKGTRDFSPAIMQKRNYIFDTIRRIFEKYGFSPLETPTMENLSVLTGKYGEEGDQLIFKIVNSGDFLAKTSVEDFNQGSKQLLPKISEKGLRYDLTVPFARYVVMNRNDITFPFKRYQMQPVWRADRPQRGRYREFYQCDADVVGTNSLICEAEIVLMINDVLHGLHFPGFEIKFNNRKILTGIAEAIGQPGAEAQLCVAIDKLDKIGWEKVREELEIAGFSNSAMEHLLPIIKLEGTFSEKMEALTDMLRNSEIGLSGLAEMQQLHALLKSYGRDAYHLDFDPTLARGLSYYTGTIFEVKAKGVVMGSISGGGRYDNLTGVFGLEGTSGVGISFGVDRIFDVMEELGLFPTSAAKDTELLVSAFDENTQIQCLPMVDRLRKAGLRVEIYPEIAKLKKQFQYADKKNIPFVVVVGPEELEKQMYSLKNMKTGEQITLQESEIATHIRD